MTQSAKELYLEILAAAAENTADVAYGDKEQHPVCDCYLGTIETYLDGGYMDNQVPLDVAALLDKHVDTARSHIKFNSSLPAEFRFNDRQLFNQVRSS